MTTQDAGASGAVVVPEAGSAARPLAPSIPEPPQSSLLPAIYKIASDPSLDVSKLEALLRMQAELERRQAERESIEAFTRVSADLPRVKKNGTIDLGKGRAIPFARWEDMDAVIRPIITAAGFTLSFNSAPRPEGGLIVTGELMHRSGHVRTVTIPLPLDQGPGRNNLQAVGSTLSYGKRYCAEMLLNIVREGQDDDGTKGGQAFVNEAEADELRALLTETGTDETRFCAIFNVAHLGELAQANLAAARNMLNLKRRKA